MPAKSNKKNKLWERLQPRMKPSFFAAEATPTMSRSTTSVMKGKTIAGMTISQVSRACE